MLRSGAMVRTLPWPKTMVPIVDVIGEQAALRLVEAFGGREINFPQNPRAESPISKVIGHDAACRLARDWGWGSFLVPLCARLKKARRDEAILKATREGASVRKLAAQHGVHIRTIRRVKAKAVRTRCG